MRDVVLVFSFILSLPTVFIRPWIGLIIWTVFSYLNPHRMCFGFAARFPFAAITAAVTICALIIHRQLRPFKLNSAVVLLVLLIAWTNITYLFALNPEDASVEWSRFMKIQLMGFVTMAAITEFRKLQVLIWATALSIAFFGVKGGLFTLATGGQHHVIGPPSTFIADNNNLALALVMTLPLLRYVQLTSRRRWVRFALGGMMALCVVSVMGSYSRAGVLSMGVVVIMTVLKSRHKAVLAVAGAICLLAGVAFMPIAWQQRVQSINNYEQDASSLGRINAWNFAWNLAKARPIIGGGFRTFTPALFTVFAPQPDNFHEAHSIYFEVLAEQGFPGLGVFLVLGVATWFEASAVRRRGRQLKQTWAVDLGGMIQVGLVGYAVGGAFLSMAYFDLPYHFLAILVVAGSVLRETPLQAAAGSPVIGRDPEASLPVAIAPSRWAPGRMTGTPIVNALPPGARG